MHEPEQRLRPHRISQWIQSRSGVVIFGAIVVCATIWLAFEHRSAAGARRTFINEQAAVVRLAAGAFEDRLRMPIFQAGIMARYDLGAIFQDQGAIGPVVDHLQTGLASYPDVMAYTLVDAGGELVYAQGVESEAGHRAINRSLDWAKQFRIETDVSPEAQFVTAPASAGGHASITALFPVRRQDEITGALIVDIDIGSAARRVFGPDTSGASSDLCLLDRQGGMIYQTDRKDCGATLRKVSRSDFHDLLTRARGVPAGSAIYSQSGGLLGFLGPRILVCWQTVTLGERSFIVCRTALMRR